MSVASALRIQRAINMRRADRLAGDVTVTAAADFLRGGAPTFARAFDRKGALVFTAERLENEPWTAFRARAGAEAGQVAGAASLLIGGLPDGMPPHALRPAKRSFLATPSSYQTFRRIRRNSKRSN